MSTGSRDQRLAECKEAIAETVARLNEILSDLDRLAGHQDPMTMVNHTEEFNWLPGEKDRTSLLPIRYDDIWAVRKTIEALHWTAQEVDLTLDRHDWTTRMTDDQRAYVKMQLAFFAYADVDVLRGLDEVCAGVDCLEAQAVYAAQKDQECVHAESYALQIDALLSGAERQHVLDAVRDLPVITRMRQWALRCFDKELPAGERLVAFAAVEGVLFSSSFAAFQLLRELNLLPGITMLNDFIARDEGIHTGFTALLVRKYLHAKPSEPDAYRIFEEAVDVVDEFVTEALPVRLIGMNADLMKLYVRFQADSVLKSMGYAANWRAENPFPFMDKLALNKVAKTNFFERVPSQYQNVSKPGQNKFALDTSLVEV